MDRRSLRDQDGASAMMEYGAQFSVCQFFQDGSYEYVRRFVEAEEAVAAFAHYTQNPASRIGIVRKVIITDGDDCINMEWQFEKGIVFPTMKSLNSTGVQPSDGRRMMKLVQAFEILIGERFRWKSRDYVVVDDYDHKNDCDRMIVREVGKELYENFNPYAYVEPI